MTHYEKGKGRIEESELCDPDWGMGPIKVYAVLGTEYDDDGFKTGTVVRWCSRMEWGDTWGDIAFGKGATPAEALTNGFEKAKKAGAPDWFFGVVPAEVLA